MPRVPSEPTMTPRRSSPIGSGLEVPSTTTSPSAVTTSTARTWFTVVPSARQWRPPRVVGHVPTDRADRLGGRVGDEIQAQRSREGAQVLVDDTRLRPHHTVLDIDFPDPVHPGGDHQERLAGGHDPSGQPGSRASGDDRHPMPGGEANDGDDILRAGREGDKAGLAADEPRIFAEHVQIERIGRHLPRAQLLT